MDTEYCRYERSGTCAVITLDDGAKNVISPSMIRSLNHSLDRAEREKTGVIVTGREEIFSAGFDLKTMKKGGAAAYKMLVGGLKLTERLLSFPMPVIIACNGHAVAMGAFLLLSGDYRICTAGPYRIATNEVAIGLTMPRTGVEVCRQRLNPAHFVRAVTLAENYSPETALEAGFADQVVPAGELMSTARGLAEKYAQLDVNAHKETKLRARSELLKELKGAIRADKWDFLMLGVRKMLGI